MHGGRIYEYAQLSGRSSSELLDFSANINPLGPPCSVQSAILQAMDGIRHYPDSRHAAVLASIKQHFGFKEGQTVFCGNGAAEIIDLTIRALSPTRVFLFEPAFSEYEIAAARMGVKTVHLSLINSELDLTYPFDRIVNMVEEGDMVILNNPHNPTGYCWTRENMVNALEILCQKNVTVIVDESFMDFRWDEEHRTMMRDVGRLTNLVVIRSATKMYSIPGLRFGFGVTHEELAERIEYRRDRWSVNHLAQVAAASAYQDNAFVRATWEWLQQEQIYILETWGKYEALDIYPPSVNYFLVCLRSELPVPRILHRLEAEGIFVRRCDNFRGLDHRYLRVAIKSHADNERLWHTFQHAVNSIL